MSYGYQNQRKKPTQPASTVKAIPVSNGNVPQGSTYATRPPVDPGGYHQPTTSVYPHSYQNKTNPTPPSNGRAPSFRRFPEGTKFHCDNTTGSFTIDAIKAENNVHAAPLEPGPSGYPHEYKNLSGISWLNKRGNEPNVKYREIPVLPSGQPYNYHEKRTKDAPPTHARAIYTTQGKDFVGVVCHPDGPKGPLQPAHCVLGGSSKPTKGKQILALFATIVIR
ncbi:hypothetical protein V8B97DRAFT_1914714 [Scleroderma yunnanense]